MLGWNAEHEVHQARNQWNTRNSAADAHMLASHLPPTQATDGSGLLPSAALLSCFPVTGTVGTVSLTVLHAAATASVLGRAPPRCAAADSVPSSEALLLLAAACSCGCSWDGTCCSRGIAAAEAEGAERGERSTAA